jgi:hypothetical protein
VFECAKKKRVPEPIHSLHQGSILKQIFRRIIKRQQFCAGGCLLMVEVQLQHSGKKYFLVILASPDPPFTKLNYQNYQL